MRKIASRITVLAFSAIAVTGIADLAHELSSPQVERTNEASERDLGWGVKASGAVPLPRLGR
ncbi:hypothetical protein ABZ250_20900 [Streptomyces afghaniensis]|uniref:hypothetical protein n=1 Tax=Streptomyces afghaniensis TaxID=66865 RepID=UPI0033A2ECC5